VLRSPALYIALLLGILLAVSQIVQYVFHFADINKLELYMDIDFMFPHSVLTSMMGFASGEWQSYALVEIAPLLAVIPFANSYYLDIKNGYVKNLYTRASKKSYLVSKYIVTFLSGAAAVAIPLLVNFLVCMMVVPYIQPITGTALFGIPFQTFWADLFYTNGILYVLGFCGIYAIFGGLYACLSLVAAFLVNNRFLVQLFPLIVIMAGSMILDISKNSLYAPRMLLQMGQGFSISGIRILLIIGALFIITLTYFWRGAKNDTI